MSATALDYTYRYQQPSSLTPAAGAAGSRLHLATCSGAGEHPHFFAGAARRPLLLGKLLLALSDVVRTHFYQPFRPALMDPVVTASEEMLRFEGFSSCCGVYARVDFEAESFDAELTGRGTTNVDFNDPMRSALARLRDGEPVRLAVGRDEVSIERSGAATVEKKVKLPVRWLKGFGEVQAYQAELEPRLEVPPPEALRFVRTLPRNARASQRPGFVTRSGRSLRLSPRESPGSVRLAGTHRVRLLEPLLPGARLLRLWSDEGSGVTAWEIEHPQARVFLVLSPEVSRGFSGEGQLLELLAAGGGHGVLRQVRAQLHWQTRIDPEGLAARLGAEPMQVHGALAALGARGLAGYDAASGTFFHRELPFDLDRVEVLQPRLRNARRLIAEGGARVLRRQGGAVDVEVPGSSGVRHQVRLAAGGDRCTCPWWSRYQGRRGPCKHLLVARLVAEGDASAAAPAGPAT